MIRAFSKIENSSSTLPLTARIGPGVGRTRICAKSLLDLSANHVDDGFQLFVMIRQKPVAAEIRNPIMRPRTTVAPVCENIALSHGKCAAIVQPRIRD
jgi:hypothetical protein